MNNITNGILAHPFPQVSPSGNERTTDVPDQGVSVQMGENTRTFAPGSQTMQPVVSEKPNDSASTTSLEDRQISAADAAQPKPYNFTFKQLEAICNGKYNVGEVALDKDGQLTKINNHVHYSDKNTVVTTPEENAKLRQQVYQCIVDQYTDKPENVLATVKDILLDKSRERLSLSRDELGQLLKGIEDGRLESEPDNLKSELKDIRAFKMGDWSNMSSGKYADANFLIGYMKDNGFIKGLVTDSENKVVSQISANAKRDVARSITDGYLKEIRDGWRGTAQKFDEGLKDCWEDVRALVNETVKRLDEEKVQPENYKKLFAERMLPQLEALFKEPLARLVLAQANPVQPQTNIAKQNAKKTYVRGCDRMGRNSKGQKIWMCFGLETFNSVINAVLAGNDPNSLKRLKKMFAPDGLKLHGLNGELKEYKYDRPDPDQPKKSDFSDYEESLSVHFKNHFREISDDQGHSDYILFAKRALGMQEVYLNELSQIESQYESGEVSGNLVKKRLLLMECERMLVNALKEQLKSGKFVMFMFAGAASNYVAIKGIELHQDGSVTLSIVDASADTDDACEYDKTYSFEEFIEQCQILTHTNRSCKRFRVLEWLPEGSGAQEPPKAN